MHSWLDLVVSARDAKLHLLQPASGARQRLEGRLCGGGGGGGCDTPQPSAQRLTFLLPRRRRRNSSMRCVQAGGEWRRSLRLTVSCCPQVLDYELQKQLIPYMRDLHPLPGIYDPDFIAANQDARADNLIKGSKRRQMETVRQQIRDFQASNGVDQVIVLWTANTERYSEVRPRRAATVTLSPAVALKLAMSLLLLLQTQLPGLERRGQGHRPLDGQRPTPSATAR